MLHLDSRAAVQRKRYKILTVYKMHICAQTTSKYTKTNMPKKCASSQKQVYMYRRLDDVFLQEGGSSGGSRGNGRREVRGSQGDAGHGDV